MATEKQQKVDEIHLGSAVDEWEALRQAFGGSQAEFVQHLLSLHRATPQISQPHQDTGQQSEIGPSVEVLDSTPILITPKEEPFSPLPDSVLSDEFKMIDAEEHVVLGRLVHVHGKDKVNTQEANSIVSSARPMEKAYSCTLCHRGFRRAAALKKHMQSHAEEKNYVTEIPESDTTVFNSPQRHTRSQNEKKTISAQPGRKPNMLTRSAKEPQNRVSVKTSGKTERLERPYTCSFCSVGFKTKNGLMTHERIHTSEKPCICVHCGKGFAQPATLSRHMKIAHGEDQTVRTRRTISKADAAEETDDNTSDVGEDDCDNSSDYNPISTIRHTKVQRTLVKIRTGDRHYACAVCDMAFKTNNHLITHTRTHTGEKPCICIHCGKGFGQPSTLGRHLRTGTCQRVRTRRSSEKKVKTLNSLPPTSTETKAVQELSSSVGDMIDDCGNSSDHKPNSTSPSAKKIQESTTLRGPIKSKNPDRPYPCPLCGLCFKSKNHLMTHERTHTGEKPCICIHCGKGFGQPATLGRHLRTASCQKVRTRRPSGKNVALRKLPSVSIQTNAVNKTNGNANERAGDDSENLEHEGSARVDEKRYTCTHCGKGFKQASILKRHMYIHSDETPLTCSQCKETFKTASVLTEHMLTHTEPRSPHPSASSDENPVLIPTLGDDLKMDGPKNDVIPDDMEAPYKPSSLTPPEGNAAGEPNGDNTEVDGCNYDNSSDYNPKDDVGTDTSEHIDLSQSLRNSPSKCANVGTFVCEQCGKEFLQKSTLTRHMYTHREGADAQPVPGCRQCAMKFTSLDELKEHRKSHRKEKKFLCTYCGKAFSNHSHLTAHLRVHTGERPFKCEHCGKGFTQNTMLTIHIRTHTGERPYVCSVCGHGSITKSTLDKHMRSHTGEKPFSCPICLRAFSDQSYIRVHIRTLHNTTDGEKPPAASPRKKRRRRKRIPWNEKPYLCCECGKRFGSMSSLDKHSILHTAEKPQTCIYCNEEFYAASLLDLHIQQAHPGEATQNAAALGNDWETLGAAQGVATDSADGVDWIASPTVLASNIPGKPHACAQCGRAFKQVAHLKAHIRIHTGERPYVCRVCGQGFTQTSILNRHIRDMHPSVSIYTCLICEAGFDTHKELREHRPTHAENAVPKIKRVECSECDRKFLHPSDMKRHLLVHTGDKPFICNHCGKGFASASSLKGHIMTHTGERPHVCPTCGKGCITSGNLRVHMRIHTGEKPYSCSQCDKRFRMKSLLTYHESTHAVVKAYLCSTCGKAFGNMINLKKHMRNVHAMERTTVCPHCGKCFKRPANLQKHIISAHTEPVTVEGEDGLELSRVVGHVRAHVAGKLYSCTRCDKHFKWASYLKIHMRTHTGEKPYACSYCTKTFITSCHLKKHIMCHTGEKPYVCPHCERRFRQQSVLKTHIRTHTGEKPFVCPDCGKRFCQSAELSRHKMVHTGEKPHICPHCGRGCQTAATLTKHIRTHTGEKPYACRHCDKTFADPSGLGTHMREHTGDKPHMCSHCGKRFTTLSKVTQHLLCHTNEKPHVCSHCGNGYKAKFTLMKHIRTHTHPHEKPPPRRRTPRGQKVPRPVHMPVYTEIPAPKHTHTLSLGPALTHTYTVNPEPTLTHTITPTPTQEVIHTPVVTPVPTPLLTHTDTVTPTPEQTLITVPEDALQTYTEDEVAISVQNIENTVTVSTTENHMGEPIYHFVILDQGQYQ